MPPRASRDLDETASIDVSRLSFSAKLGLSVATGFFALVMPIVTMLWTIKAEQGNQAKSIEFNQTLTHQQLETLQSNMKDYKDATAATLSDHTRQLNYLNATIQQLELSLAKDGKVIR